MAVVMNTWLERIILSLFLRRLLPTSLLTLLRVLFEMFILFWIGRTVAYRGKHSSTLTFLCVVITEQTVRLLAGLYSLSLFLSFVSLSLCFYRLFLLGKISSFLSCLSSCLLFGFFYFWSIKGCLASSLHLWFSTTQMSVPGSIQVEMYPQHSWHCVD